MGSVMLYTKFDVHKICCQCHGSLAYCNYFNDSNNNYYYITHYAMHAHAEVLVHNNIIIIIHVKNQYKDIQLKLFHH